VILEFIDKVFGKTSKIIHSYNNKKVSFSESII